MELEGALRSHNTLGKEPDRLTVLIFKTSQSYRNQNSVMLAQGQMHRPPPVYMCVCMHVSKCVHMHVCMWVGLHVHGCEFMCECAPIHIFHIFVECQTL